MLDTLMQVHPRLIFTEKRAAEVRQLAQTDSDLQELLSFVREIADATLAAPPLQSHNTLTIGNTIQRVEGTAPLVKHNSDDTCAFAIFDLTSAYATEAHRVRRGVMLLNRQRILVQDELSGFASDADVCWPLMTRAAIDAEKTSARAVLALDSKEMTVEILSPQKARFDVVDAIPPRRPSIKMQAISG